MSLIRKRQGRVSPASVSELHSPGNVRFDLCRFESIRSANHPHMAKLESLISVIDVGNLVIAVSDVAEGRIRGRDVVKVLFEQFTCCRRRHWLVRVANLLPKNPVPGRKSA